MNKLGVSGRITGAVFLAAAIALGAGNVRAQEKPAPQVVQKVPASPAAAEGAGKTDPQAKTGAANKNAKELELNARQIALGGALKSVHLWEQYKSRFVTAQGRVIDSANGMISHSEGQGYGMLLAVAANDRDAFDRIWNWTRGNLMVRDDQLIAWRWEPGQRPPVTDMNNATDGDILVSWALTEAAELWAELSYRVAARRIAVEIGRKTVLFKQQPGSLILPAVAGFSAEERRDGPVINLSYYVFPALARLSIVAPEYDWSGLSQAGLDIARQARFGASQLPTEWISVREGKAKPAAGFPAQFSYNAIRIPLYMAWAGIGDWVHYEPYFNWGVNGKSAPAIIDVHSNRIVGIFRDPGFAAIGQLLSCLPEKGKISRSFLNAQPAQNYYPATLHIMAVVAVEMRYPSCVR